ncbi:MAG: hypothetical protein ABEJ92_05250 [Halobacteriales archaeon]
MRAAIARFAAFAVYQLSLLVGIALLPLAVLARHGGFRLPVGRLVERTGRAYASTRDR